MILRRLTQHVKDQNWFAVGLDFVIVVVGVFLGIQIGNWNDDRVLRQKAAGLEQQLVVEMAKEAMSFRFVRTYYEDVQANGEAVLADVEGTIKLPDEAYVIKAFRATQYTNARTTRYAFNDIVAAGIADLINNRTLMVAADFIYNYPWQNVAEQEGRASAYRRLFRETVPLDVQRDARLSCGDLDWANMGDDEFRVMLSAPDLVLLDYSCSLSVPADRIAFAAKALREADGLETALRLRIAEMDNTNALIGLAEETMRPWRMTPEAFAKAEKERSEP